MRRSVTEGKILDAEKALSLLYEGLHARLSTVMILSSLKFLSRPSGHKVSRTRPNNQAPHIHMHDER
jgi:hypothetical protein